MSAAVVRTPDFPVASIIQYGCPKKCNRKLHGAPGDCACCGTKLAQVRDGYLEHTDHHPKRGGAFFMASDHAHHLEGTLEFLTEFRIYFYDNFTTAIQADFKANAEISGVDAVWPHPTRTDRLSMTRSATGDYLAVEIPKGYTLPVSIAVRIEFEKSKPAELFNFSFTRLTTSPQSAVPSPGFQSMIEWVPTQ